MIILIDSEDNEVVGKFKSVDEAKRHLRECIKESYEGWDDCKRGDHDDWALPYYICEVVDVVKPVPNVKITVKLKKQLTT